MILLGYHPDLSSGNHDTLTLMFDMNKLWEAFISSTLCKLRYDGWTVRFQNRKMFWESESNLKVGIKPDIFIEKDNVRIVLDTKWKNLGYKSPSVEDLRQMFVYSQYWKATHTALVYPGAHSQWSDGDFASISSKEEKIRCGIITIKPELRISEWQKRILEIIALNT
jgi:5-methylcytosine-specific restriction enzyme subunit McrC